MVLTPLRYRLFLLLIAAVLVGIGSQSHRWVNAQRIEVSGGMRI